MDTMELDNCVKFERDNSTFLLNTNTTCFLCLNTTFPGQISNENETFIKLENEEDVRSQSQQSQLSLLNIFRYLKIDYKQLITINSVDKDKIIDEMSNFSVILCQKCSTVTAKLSDLCLEMEVLQMKVDHCLQTFQDELKNSEMDVIRNQKFQQLKAGQLEEIQVNLAVNLRKMLKKRCDIKLNSILPKVILSDANKTAEMTTPPNHQNPPATSLQDPPATPPDDNEPPTKVIKSIRIYHCPLCTMSFNIKGQLPTHMRLRHTVPSASTDESPISVSADTLDAISKSRKVQLQICDLCQPPLAISSLVTKKHQILKHIDHLLTPSTKSPNVSSEDFKIYSKHLFHVETISARKSVNFKGKIIRHCQYCTKKFTTNEHLKLHLFNNHQDILSKELTELQKTTTINEINAVKLPPLFPPGKKEFSCDDCGNSFTLSSSVKRHQETVCDYGPHLPYKRPPPKKIKAEGQQEESSKQSEEPIRSSKRTFDYDYTCKLCVPPCTLARRAIKKHQVRMHFDYLMREYKLDNMSSEDFKIYCDHVFKSEAIATRRANNVQKGFQLWTCPHCQKTYTTREHMKVHIYSSHQEILIEQLMELQKSINVEELKGNCFKCPDCDRKFKLPSHVTLHQKSAHNHQALTKKNTSNSTSGAGNDHVETPPPPPPVPPPEEGGVSIEMDTDGQHEDLGLGGGPEDEDGSEEDYYEGQGQNDSHLEVEAVDVVMKIENGEEDDDPLNI